MYLLVCFHDYLCLSWVLVFKQGIPLDFGSITSLTKGWWSSSLPACACLDSSGHFFLWTWETESWFPFLFVLFVLSSRTILSCLFWQMISEKGSVTEIAGIILASSNSYLLPLPPPNKVTSSPCFSSSWIFPFDFLCVLFCCCCLIISFCGPFSYNFFCHQLGAFLSQAKKVK